MKSMHLFIWGVLATTITSINNSHAETAFSERFSLSLGASVTTFDSSLDLDAVNSIVDRPIDIEDDLKFDEEINLANFSAYWRFAPRHRILFDYLPADRTSSAKLSNDIYFDGDTISAGADTKANYDTTIYDLSYLYSIYQSEDLEMGAGVGLYWMQIDLSISASGFISSESQGRGGKAFNANYKNSGDVDVPLPTLNGFVSYRVLPSWYLKGNIQYFDLSLDSFYGHMTSVSLSSEYYFTQYWGLGASISMLDLDIQSDISFFRGDLAWAYQGASLYLTAKY
ncbi:hypothetical protein SIN8267_01940 [Sinobacterium norvegicum]|uniref:Solitary outer membrane autotransporter beta-barrel domain-containing protein n=1 Tax=Sinobacterium norvegicum TaxID=1641715 RepID=A0ABN8EJA9_9GAMM|nr:hypothetical protein [Sinobacterium norvegicum]CAH0991825.1 hypothetical protein SIN8267_01940 [Sinobacterium norvegicum]